MPKVILTDAKERSTPINLILGFSNTVLVHFCVKRLVTIVKQGSSDDHSYQVFLHV